MNACNVLMCILVLLIVPTCVGYAVCQFFQLPRNVATCYLGGSFAEWALLQWVSVPLTLFKSGFNALVWIVSAALGVLCLCGVMGFFKKQRASARQKPAQSKTAWKAEDVFALLALVAAYLYLVYNLAVHQHIDLDDARFVVTAVDIENTNRLFLTDYGTGRAITEFLGPLRHDLFSPWVVYYAYVARLTATPVAVVAHTVLPQSLMLCALSAWWCLADRHFHDRRFEKISTVFLVILITIYSNNPSNTPESFILRRFWQGKAVVAGIGIPVMYLTLIRLKNEAEGWRPYLLLYVVAFAMCFMSAMGIIMCCMLCGTFGLAYGIQARSITKALKIWGGALVCLSYVGVMMILMT